MRTLFLLPLLLLAIPAPASAARVEELIEVRGVRPNQLTGYGLVVGLNGTGDRGQARFTVQSTAGMLRRLGANIDPAEIQTRNAAAVIITATLPPFGHPGTRIDVQVSSLGNARSLLGGTLVQTPLYGADRNVYAVAQGSVLVGGFSASGSSGSSVSLNHVTAGRVPRGAIIERQAPSPELNGDSLTLAVREPSFTTARRIVDAINEQFGDGVARAPNPATVHVAVPSAFRSNAVELLSDIQALQVDPGRPARVVIDERSGTVVLGGGVTISEVAIAQGGLTIEVREVFNVSQPNQLADGDTAVVPDSEVEARVRQANIAHIPAQASLSDVVSALNALGASPRDLISIFQALRTAGALNADLEVQ